MSAAEIPDPEPGSLRTDVLQSLRNALKLGLSLVASWAVALVVRILLPRALGPAAFGVYQFADAFTIMIFVVTSLGIETYVRKEVATRRDHASEFFAGILLVALALSVVITILAVVGLRAAGKPDEVLHLVLVLGAVQMLVNVNGTTAALLHAEGKVNGLSVLNVGAKFAWAAGIGIALTRGDGIEGVAIAALIAEVLRTTGLAILARRHAGVRLVVDMRASIAVLMASLPYYLHALAQTVYARLDMSILSFLTHDTEVGWYGAAQALAGLSLLMAPLIGWVLLPLISRAAARSAEELMLVTRRALEFILAVALPITLFLWLGADILVATAFGEAFAPAAHSLRILAPTFVLTYAAMVSASVLVRLERGWAVTWISVSGMVLSATLNVVLVPRFLATYGAGGAGMGAATSLIITEFYVVAVMMWLLGRRTVDRRMLSMLARTLAVCAVVVAANHLLLPIGRWRLGLETLLYVLLAALTGAIDVRGGVALLRDAIGSRHLAPAEGT